MAGIPRHKRHKQVGHWGKGCSDQMTLPMFEQHEAELKAATAAASAFFGEDTVVTVHKRPPKEAAATGGTYEEVNWPRLSPAFRAAHNKLRVRRGMTPIPDPKVDLYVAPRAAPRPVDATDPEYIAAARAFVQSPFMLRGGEGFEIRNDPRAAAGIV